MSGFIKDDMPRLPMPMPSRIDLGRIDDSHISDKWMSGLNDKYPIVQKFDVETETDVFKALLGTPVGGDGTVGESDFLWVRDGKGKLRWVGKNR